MVDLIDEALRSGADAHRRRDYGVAKVSFERAALLAPADPRPLVNLGATYLALNRLSEAEASLRQAISMEPDIAFARTTLGKVLLQLGRSEEAVASFRAALAQRDDPATRFGLGFALLSLGDPEGWVHYESRSALRNTWPDKVEIWRGEPLDGRPLCIWPEQGLGDVIMASRFSAELPATIYCQPELLRLLAAMNLQVASISPAVVPPRAVGRKCLSLPLLFGISPTSPPPPLAPRVSPRGRGGVGVMVRGRPTHANDANRSLTPDAAARLLALPRAVNLDPTATGAADFLETAEIIAGLDIVISVDTAVAHLSGSLGKPTFILLPAIGVDWRWMYDRTDSPWYPSTTLVRRQADASSWHEAIERALFLAGI